PGDGRHHSPSGPYRQRINSRRRAVSASGVSHAPKEEGRGEGERDLARKPEASGGLAQEEVARRTGPRLRERQDRGRREQGTAVARRLRSPAGLRRGTNAPAPPAAEARLPEPVQKTLRHRQPGPDGRFPG